MFIIIFSPTIQHPFMSSIEVSFIYNPFLIKDKIVKLQPSCLGSSGKEHLPRMYLGNTGFDPRENNAWPVFMPLRTSRISRPPLVGWKPVRKKKKKKDC